VNHVKAWLFLIGNKDRARRLLSCDFTNEDVIEVMFGESQVAVYNDSRFKEAIDKYDTGFITERDLKIWAKCIIKGEYDGKVY